ncbi:aldehyde dehydrogenase family 2 member C4-like [Gossypium australe]|uniref:Aldehyde dehydrogenase family 2 member C4-like n=1 Tax=Gossypium australe TaxID=47621 RepID=A0A5B6WK58_9ROSI|nr:aldehyde dehydrogenase family 2 member C4-like [Gossypium australe]
MKTCQNIVRAFDGTERRVMGKIKIHFLIGPNMPWIHSTGAVPSSLHQKLVTEGRLITINTEEYIIASVTSNAPYIGANDEAIECSFRYLEFVNATFIIEGNNVLIPKISKTTRMGLQLTSIAGKRTRKITSRKGRDTNTNRQTRLLWLRIQARCEAKEERAGEKERKEKSVTDRGRGQVGTDNLSSYI